LFATYINHFQFTSQDHWKVKHIQEYLDKNYGVIELGDKFKWRGVFQKERQMKGIILQWIYENASIIVKVLFASILGFLIFKNISS
jgi:hypothetical protein